jgi:hypothetical protein
LDNEVQLGIAFPGGRIDSIGCIALGLEPFKQRKELEIKKKVDLDSI